MTISYFNVNDDEFNLLAFLFTLLYFTLTVRLYQRRCHREKMKLSIGFKLLSLKPLIQFFGGDPFVL